MNIALFGGSFDPPHFGHKKIIINAKKILDIDKFIIMPTFLNPFKNSSHFDCSTRLKMLKDLCEDIQDIEISNYEIDQNQKVPTIQTVKFLYSKYDIDKFYLIIGADNLAKLKQWYCFEQLNSKVEFVIATRDNIKISTKYRILNINCDISSTKIRETLDTINN
jgi:nicotinate-nucleotide adenylyltransferase